MIFSLKTRLFFRILKEDHYLEICGFPLTAAIVLHLKPKCIQDPCPHCADGGDRKPAAVQVEVRNRINNSSNLMRRLLGIEKFKKKIL